jgi:hypothetical protein
MNEAVLAGISLTLFGIGGLWALGNWDFTEAPMRTLMEMFRMAMGLIASFIAIIGLMFIAAGLGVDQAKVFIELVIVPLLKWIF